MTRRIEAIVRDLGRNYADGVRSLEIRIPKESAGDLSPRDDERHPARLWVGGKEFNAGIRSTEENPNVTISPDLQSLTTGATNLGTLLAANGFRANETIELEISTVDVSQRGRTQRMAKIAVHKKGEATGGHGESPDETGIWPVELSTPQLNVWAEYFRVLCGNNELGSQVARFVAFTIQTASQLDPARWGVTARRDGLRINVGKMEAVLLNEGVLSVMVEQNALMRAPDQRTIRSMTALEFGRYKSVPSSGFIRLSLEDAFKSRVQIGAIRDAHVAHLRLAVKTALNPASRKSHSGFFIRALSELLGVALPQPSYYVDEELDDEKSPEPQVADVYEEGRARDVVLTVAERDPKARAACLAHYGYACAACDTKMEDVYGVVARDLIHVHHLHELGGGRGERVTDPVKDLRPLCPNCHAVVHRQTPVLDIPALRQLIRAQNGT